MTCNHRLFSAMFTTLFLGVLCLSTQISGDDSSETDTFSLAFSDFTADFLKSLVTSPSQNILFSPSSIDILLSQLQHGSAGKTAEQLNAVLRRDSSTSRQGYSQLLKSIANGSKGVTMKIAAKTYVRPDILLNDEFKNISADAFGAGFENIDMAAPESVAEINKWVASATNGRIKDLLSEGSLTSDSIMVLLSAVYFKGKWKETFRKGKSPTARFFVTPGATVDASFMVQSRRMVSGMNSKLGLKWVQLPYQGEKFHMLLILPTVDHQLDAVIKNLSGKDLNDLMKSTNTHYVRLRMPRFKLKLKTKLQEVLKSMGLTEMFTDEAEFPGISAKQGTKVSEALHDAFLEVNEEGSEASAGTALVVNTLSLSSNSDEFQFTANQPFLAVVYDKTRNVPHFVAKVANPSLS